MRARTLLICAAVLCLLAASAQAQYWGPVAPKFTLTLTPDNGDSQLAAPVTWTEARAGGYIVTEDLFPKASPDGYADKLGLTIQITTGAKVTGVSFGTYATGNNLKTGKFTGADNKGTTNPFMDFFYGAHQCDTQGDFNITKLAIEYHKAVGLNGAVTWESHVVNLDATFNSGCAGASQQVHGSLTYSDTPKGGLPAPETTDQSGGGGGGGGSTPGNQSDVVIGTSDAYAEPLAILNGQSMSIPLHVYSPTGFASDLFLSATSDSPEGNDFNVSVSPDFIPTPGNGDINLKIDVGPTAMPRDYIVTVNATTNEETPRTFSTNFMISLNCDPPMILGVDQPQSQSVDRGSAATVSVKATGSGPFFYQWYNGYPGLTWSPVSGATNASFTTPAVTDTNTYWVRVSNPCGSTDSNAVTVSPK